MCTASSVCVRQAVGVSQHEVEETRMRGRIWKHNMAAETVNDSYQSDFQATTRKLVFFFN